MKNGEVYKITSSHGELYTDADGKVLRVELDNCGDCGDNIESFDLVGYKEDWGQEPPTEIDILDLRWKFRDGSRYTPTSLLLNSCPDIEMLCKYIPFRTAKYICPKGHDAIFEEVVESIVYPFVCVECGENYYEFELKKNGGTYEESKG